MKKVEILPNAVYTTEEAAEILGLTVQTIQKYIRIKKIEATLIGGKWYRISGQALRDFVEACKKLRVILASYRLSDEDKWIPKVEVVEDFGSSIKVKVWVWHKQKCHTKEAADYYARIAVNKMLSKTRGEPEDELAYALEESKTRKR